MSGSTYSKLLTEKEQITVLLGKKKKKKKKKKEKKEDELILFPEMIAVYCEKSTKSIHTHGRQSALFVHTQAWGTCSNHCALEGKGDVCVLQQSSFIPNLFLKQTNKQEYTIL